jgi:hypothetical protein
LALSLQTHNQRGLLLGAFVEVNGQPISCLPGCHTAVPAELESEKLCVGHFLQRVEHTCADMRRETVVGGSSAVRRSEIAAHVKGTAEKLSRVAVISPPLTDEMKKRVLTTFLTLMNLQERLHRSATRNAPGPQSVRPTAARSLTALAVGHR